MKARWMMFLAAIAALLLLPSPAHALEYWTWGGFDVTVNGLERIGLWTSARIYLVFASIVLIFGIIAGGQSLAKGDWKKLGIAILGWSLFLGAVLIKTTTWVYDPILNRNQAVGGVPVFVDLFAGGLNAVERDIVDVIVTSGDPLGFGESADGVGYRKLLDASMEYLTAHNADMEKTLGQYIEDCVTFARRPGGPITDQELMNNNTDMLAVLAKASNYAIYTTIWAPPARPGATCGESWLVLNTYYANPASWDLLLKDVCNNGVFKAGNMMERAQCETQISQWAQFATGVSTDAVGYLRQIYLSEQLMRSQMAMNGAPAANMAYMTSAAGGYEFSLQWVPLMRNWIAVNSLMVIPWLLVFMPSQMFLRAIQWSIGLLLYPVVWTVMDAMTHSTIVDMSNNLFEQVRDGKLGINALILVPNNAAAMLGVLYKAHTINAMFAGALVGFFVQTGGHASALMAQQFSRDVRDGGQAVGDMLSPTGAASRIGAAKQGFGEIYNAATHDSRTFMQEAEHKAVTPTNTFKATLDNSFHGDVERMNTGAANKMSLELGAGMLGTEQFIEHSGGMGAALKKKAHAGAVNDVERTEEAFQKTLDQASISAAAAGGRDREMGAAFVGPAGAGLYDGTGVPAGSLESLMKDAADTAGGVSHYRTRQSVEDRDRAEVIGAFTGKDEWQTPAFMTNPVFGFESAAAAQQQGFDGIRPLMKMDTSSFAYDPETHKPTNVAVSANMTGPQALEWADWLEKKGFHESAQTVRQEAATVETAGGAVGIQAVFGVDGRPVNVSAFHVASAKFSDTGKVESGISQSYGPKYAGAYDAALIGKDSGYIAQITSRMGNEQKVEINEFATAWSAGAGAFLTKNGSSADSSAAELGLPATLKAISPVGVSINWSSTNTSGANLLNLAMRESMSVWAAEAHKHGLHGEKAESYVMAKAHDYTLAFQREIEAARPADYGATAVPSRVLKATVEKVKPDPGQQNTILGTLPTNTDNRI